MTLDKYLPNKRWSVTESVEKRWSFTSLKRVLGTTHYLTLPLLLGQINMDGDCLIQDFDPLFFNL